MASKSKSRRRVFRASCILAALIVAGSSFAWFTSSDEVTNRLTASADYGVTIAEDFTPPEKWVPGQTIEKNVGVVNTGNIDAFVRTWLEGEMNFLAEKRDKTTWDATNGKFTDQTPTAKDVLTSSAVYTKDASDSDKDTVTGLTKTTDDNLNKLGMTYSYTDGNVTEGANTKVYLKELDTAIYLNPNDPTVAGTNPVGTTPAGGFNEVMTVQAGGVLAYLKTGTAADGTYFYYKPNNSNTFKSKKGYTYEVDGSEQYQVVLKGSTGLTVDGDDIEVKNNKIIVASEDDIVKYLGNHIDSDNFYPASTGLYVFRRNSDKDKTTVDPTISDYEFSGYYYVKSSSEEGIKAATAATEDSPAKTSAENTFANQGKYFALQYENDNSQRSDYVLEKDTYMVIRDDDGNVTFKPSTKTNYKTVTGSNPVYYSDGTSYYNAKGEKLTGEDATAAETALASSKEKSVTLFTAQEDVLENKDLKWNYYENAAFYNQAAYYKDNGNWYPVGSTTALRSTVLAENTVITALEAETPVPMYVVTDGTGKLKIDIALANIGTAVAASANDAEKWTRIEGARAEGKYTGASDTFYYNNDVEEGATTSKLVDSVTMDSTITQYDFIAFDFDLNVFSDSIQVTLDSDGTEKTDTVTPWAADNGNGNTAKAATGTKGGTDTEIEYITWTTT